MNQVVYLLLGFFAGVLSALIAVILLVVIHGGAVELDGLREEQDERRWMEPWKDAIRKLPEP